ncbi:MAG: bifunctional oligoribonuclease/PAP phosphatase NrnA [Erysipelotrichaceae bacterium]|nr:bifunctional oligoribonuclease/PAP phosphatase NrnA [Erysipelotrichaceae bacterium]
MSNNREVKQLIEQYDSICIYRHIRADYDAYGSQLGLKHLIMDNYPDKHVYALGEDDLDNPELLEALDSPEDEIISRSLAVIVDTSNIARVQLESYRKCADSIRLDHHPFVEQICNCEIIDTDASSASQLVAELAIESDWKISSRAAELLYTGISTDTLKMTIEKVDSRLFRVLAVLKDTGINLDELNRRIYDQDVSMYQAETTARTRITFINDFAYLMLRSEDLREMGLKDEEARDMVNMMQNIKGINKYATIIEDDKDHDFNVSLRSHGIAINEIARKYGGGGHPNASGIGHLKGEFINYLIKDMTGK